MGLRISREVAARLAAGGGTLDTTAPLRLPDARSARELAALLASAETPEALTAGRLTAVLELAATLRMRLEAYFEERERVLDELLELLAARMGEETLRVALGAVSEALLVREAQTPDGTSAVLPAEPEPALLEALLLWALDSNPAAASVSRSLQGRQLRGNPALDRLLAELPDLLDDAPPLDPRAENLADSLQAAAVAAPDSLPDQLRFVLDSQADLAPAERAGLVASLDLIAEEQAPRFPPGPGPVELPDFDDLEDEAPRFSADRHWMETLVVIAKNTYVWLDELSRRSGEELRRLDQIPDAELDRLAAAGVSGLWLIGIWSRSRASARIKQLMGDTDALASAYSLREYRIAEELGGEAALAELSERAAARGIRLAADMVPNHLGLDSSWLIEHPERFLSVRRCPFPSYTFDGPDLSPDPQVGIYLEDHYYDRSDAAVVFKRVDRRTGDIRFVYHGNDGTSTPWNDTAQLDYLNPETREAVIGEILRVAGAFPVIRFDAAMTLARRHVQRLWYPEPGAGGAIPSRSDHALSADDFRRAMPTEFWREVVERVAKERSETLLLAEAFWLMEGFFVRSLGMHRVYNSAFMILLRDGRTEKLRELIRETLDFDPRILARYANFLSNPDEASAIEQFGAEDRYFGACTVMATLPGLPMVAHGQFEGYREKFGMEFRRARMTEEPDSRLLERHRRQIFPLLRRRGQFAGVDGFRLLDLEDEAGAVNGSVLAYANGRGVERSIVVFNNSPDRVQGVLAGAGEGLEIEDGTVCRFRDRTTGLQFVATAERLGGSGLEVKLEPFESRVLVDFRPVLKTVQEPFARLAERSSGRGFRNLELELELLELLPVVEAVSSFVDVRRGKGKSSAARFRRAVGRARRAVEATATGYQPGLDRGALRSGLARAMACGRLQRAVEVLPWPAGERMQDARRRAVSLVASGGSSLIGLRALAVVAGLRAALGNEIEAGIWDRVFEELPVESPPPRALSVALDEGWLEPRPAPGGDDLAAMLDGWSKRGDAARLLGINHHAGEVWVRREELELLLRWRGITALSAWLLHGDTPGRPDEEAALNAVAWFQSMDLFAGVCERAGYAVSRIRAVAGGDVAGSAKD